MDKEIKLQPVRKTPMALLVDASLKVQKTRVIADVRKAHLERRRMMCPDTEELLTRIRPVEEWLDSRLRSLMVEHPTYWWTSHVRGLGKLIIAKGVGVIEKFGKYYEVSDPLCPTNGIVEDYVTLDGEGNIVELQGVWIPGIERLVTPSKQRVYLGLTPDSKRVKGRMLSYSSDGKMMFWRIGSQLLRAGGKYYYFYVRYKEYLTERELAKGTKIIPTPKERFCVNCFKEVVKKKAMYCPDCGGDLTLKKEPPGVLYAGHLDNMAKRRMIQLFSDHLNVVWRQSLGLPVRDPYPVEHLGHSTIIRPEDMMDKLCDNKNCSICQQINVVRKPRKEKVAVA